MTAFRTSFHQKSCGQKIWDLLILTTWSNWRSASRQTFTGKNRSSLLMVFCLFVKSSGFKTRTFDKPSCGYRMVSMKSDGFSLKTITKPSHFQHMVLVWFWSSFSSDCGEMTEVCVIEDKTAVVVVASYRSVSRNPVRFKALICN